MDYDYQIINRKLTEISNIIAVILIFNTNKTHFFFDMFTQKGEWGGGGGEKFELVTSA